jgi:hypothetical protein
MIQFLQENAGWIGTIAAALITGIFAIYKKKGKYNKQIVKNIKDSNVTMNNKQE